MGTSYAQKFGIKFVGGLNYLSVGDINAGIKGYFDLRKDQAAEMPGISVEGDPSPLHLGFNFEISFMINLTPKWGIGLGVGYIRASNTSEIILQQPGGYEIRGSHKPEISTIPIRLGIYYTLLRKEVVNVYLNAGAGVYFAEYSYDLQPIATGEWAMYQTASASNIGFHGGVGVELKLAKKIAFILEGQARFAKIGSFNGTIKHAGYLEHTEEGTLYYWEQIFGVGKDSQIIGKYPQVYIRGNRPSGSHISNVRDATIDFSGFAFMAGIKFDF